MSDESKAIGASLDGLDRMVVDGLMMARQHIRKLSARFRAPIVCICGSTRFKQAWIAENARLTGEGNIVLAVGLWGHHERVSPTPEQKQFLDDLHKRKIDLCDWVWVLDINGHIGESTRSEIEYATKLGRPIRYLSQEFPDYVEPVDYVVHERNILARALHKALNDWQESENEWAQFREDVGSGYLPPPNVREEFSNATAIFARIILKEEGQ